MPRGTDAPIASIRTLYAFNERKTNCRKFYRVDLKCDEVRSHIKSRSAFVIIARQRDGKINQTSRKTSKRHVKIADVVHRGALLALPSQGRCFSSKRTARVKEATAAIDKRRPPIRNVLRSTLSVDTQNGKAKRYKWK